MENGDVDHVKWLRKQAGTLLVAAEKESDEKKKATKSNTAMRLRNAANALEVALAGVDPGAMGGHAGLLKRLRPGARVRARLVTGEEMVGVMRAMGRYEYALLLDTGEERVVTKGGTVYWVLLGEEESLSQLSGLSLTYSLTLSQGEREPE